MDSGGGGEDGVLGSQSGLSDGPVIGKDYFFITAQPEAAPDKLSSVECWCIGSDFAQLARVFRNSIVAPGTLTVIADSYIAGGAVRKPWISVWPLNQPTPLQPPLLTPLPVTKIAVSPDGEYLVVAMGNKLHVYRLSTGDFLGVLARHYQPITALAFTSSGRHFASAGQDGIIFIWKTFEVVNATRDRLPNPQMVSCQNWIEDLIFAGSDAVCVYLISVGRDSVCRVIDPIFTFAILGTFVFRRSLLTVTADSSVTSAALSDDSGDIYRLPLITEDSRSNHAGLISETDWNQRYRFSGHRMPVRCLQFSTDGSLLISGSDDSTVRIWQVESRICVRVLQFKGPVKNLVRCRHPEVMFAKRSLSSARPLVPLKKQLHSELISPDDDQSFDFHIPPRSLLKNINPVTSPPTNMPFDESASKGDPDTHNQQKANSLLLEQLHEKEQEIEKLKSINEELYEFARDTVFNTYDNS
ncbi:WD repeat-containing protein 18-like [Paramacrobiotus metropolitanus]|uniref:WD repeat-containing protein 18-like n=1 Tax=Paramacrobiotus metropolitanus TaxID=2943436 RepID=UPI002445F59D|nr:WD repeat-containing protein 18-like [Paramacrobiotus metropolitanus]